MKIISLVLSLLLVSCGQSPIFNHINAKDSKGSTQAGPAKNPSTVPAPTTQPKCNLDFPKAGLCGVLSWDNALSPENDNPFTLSFYSRTTNELQDPTLTAFVQLWMPSMGHGSSPVTLTHAGLGTYKGTQVFFVMPGEWDVRVQLKKANAVSEQAILRVKL